MPIPSSSSSVSQSYARVWIWQERENNTATTYHHISLETHTGGNQDHTTFISFYENSHPSHFPCKKQGVHFHLTKETDDQIYDKASLIHYDLLLNIDSINHAFERFKQNPHGWASLGYHFLHNPYPFNSVGLTVYLLGKGGVFKHVLKKGNIYSEIFRIVAISGTAFSIFNHLSSYQLYRLALSSDLKKYTSGLGRTLAISNSVNVACAKICKLAQEVISHYPSEEAVEINIAAEETNGLLNQIYPDRPSFSLILTPSIRAAAYTASQEIFKISGVCCVVTVAALGCYWLTNRYLVRQYNFSDVEELVQKAPKTNNPNRL